MQTGRGDVRADRAAPARRAPLAPLANPPRYGPHWMSGRGALIKGARFPYTRRHPCLLAPRYRKASARGRGPGVRHLRIFHGLGESGGRDRSGLDHA
jgi:hypothetical protein